MHLLGTVCSSQPFAIYQPGGRQKGAESSRVTAVGTEMLGDALLRAGPLVGEDTAWRDSAISAMESVHPFIKLPLRVFVPQFYSNFYSKMILENFLSSNWAVVRGQ